MDVHNLQYTIPFNVDNVAQVAKRKPFDNFVFLRLNKISFQP